MLSRDLFIGRVKDGYGYCQGCGDPNVPPGEDWKTHDSACYAERKPERYCKDCGGALEAARVKYAKKKGGSCRKCLNCSRGWTKPHPIHNVKLPDRFFASLTPVK